MSLLQIKNLSVELGGKEILKEVNLEIGDGEVCVLMGPNGAGKSTLSNVIMGDEKFDISSGEIVFNNFNINQLKVEERAKKGLFMSFQSPIEIDGVTMANFLRTSYNSLKEESLNLTNFHKLLNSKMEELNIDSTFRKRFVNKGFSGGEKKKSEVLQMVLLEPKLAILDEIDSGIDVDSLKLISDTVNKLKEKNNMSVIIITHHKKILDHINIDKVFIMKEGKIVESGDSSLVHKVEREGFK